MASRGCYRATYEFDWIVEGGPSADKVAAALEVLFDVEVDVKLGPTCKYPTFYVCVYSASKVRAFEKWLEEVTGEDPKDTITDDTEGSPLR